MQKGTRCRWPSGGKISTVRSDGQGNPVAGEKAPVQVGTAQVSFGKQAESSTAEQTDYSKNYQNVGVADDKGEKT